MQQLNYDSIAEVAEFLRNRELAPKKRFGQNLLVNAGARRRIVDAVECIPTDVVWEIGPGIGALTSLLVDVSGAVVAFEIDRGFARALADLLADSTGLRIVEGDFLKTWETERDVSGEPDRIVGNLPYSSAAAILVALVRRDCRAHRIVCTVQKEIGERMRAHPGAESYSSFSVMMQARYAIREIGSLRPGSFYPAPRVASTILELTRLSTEIRPNPGFFSDVLRSLFAYRRKTLRNNLQRGIASGFSEKQLTDFLGICGVRPESRPEELTVDQCLQLASELSTVIGHKDPA